MMAARVAIIGGGNLGTAIARGLAASGKISADKITITRRSIHLLDGLKQEGFRVESDNLVAVRSARGAVTLLLDGNTHPEVEIDKVTTPMGVTIAGLNEMEHHGFSSSMIRGIVTSAEKAAKLYQRQENGNGKDQ
jgi:pyrroline-5-carboxylate reductase